MPYLKTFTFPGWEEEELCTAIEVTCYDSFYPFQVLGRKELGKVEFGAITIFYGGNGSGKSTLLNIIAEKLRLKRESPFNKSAFFPRYLQCCVEECVRYIPTDSCIITSDEVFDHLLKLRLQNEKIDLTREELFRNHYERRREEFRMQSLDDYEHLKDVNL